MLSYEAVHYLHGFHALTVVFLYPNSIFKEYLQYMVLYRLNRSSDKNYCLLLKNLTNLRYDPGFAQSQFLYSVLTGLQKADNEKSGYFLGNQISCATLHNSLIGGV